MNRISFTATGALVLMLVLAPAESVSQTCFRGGGRERCRTFWITEFELSRRMDTPPVVRSGREDFFEKAYLSGEIGHMVNVDNRFAVGGTVLLAGTSGTGLFGVKLRMRRWIDPYAAADFGLGILLAGSEMDYHARFPGLTGHVGLRFGDLVGVSLRADVISGDPLRYKPSGPGGADVALYLGVTTGSFAALLSSTAIAFYAMSAVGSFGLDCSSVGY